MSNSEIILRPEPSGIAVLEEIAEPYRPLEPFTLPNKPQMIDPMVTRLQICMIDQGKVIGQCNSPTDENDFDGWQRVIAFYRSLVEMVKPTRPKLCFMRKGDVIGEPQNVPATASDMHAWQDDMIHLRLIVAVVRREHM